MIAFDYSCTRAQLSPAPCVAMFRFRLESHLDRQDPEGQAWASGLFSRFVSVSVQLPWPVAVLCLLLGFPGPRTSPALLRFSISGW